MTASDKMSTRPGRLASPGRRDLIRKLGATSALAAGVGVMPLVGGYHQARSAEPIRIGFQVHRTGIGAAYGRWYSRTTDAAVRKINAEGGINGRPVEIIAEDDGTDPKRGAEVVEKLATQHRCDLVFGTLFSHVVIGRRWGLTTTGHRFLMQGMYRPMPTCSAAGKRCISSRPGWRHHPIAAPLTAPG